MTSATEISASDTSASTPANSTPQTADMHNPEDALITALCVGPQLREVAATLLRDALKERYPELNIDPVSTVVGTCAWQIRDDSIVDLAPTYQPLPDILASQTLEKDPCLYIEGKHFLAQLPLSNPVVHLPVRITEIGNLINLLAPVMFRAFQEQQIAYWNGADNGPRWHDLANILRQLWNVQQVKGWSETDCAMARRLHENPVRANRMINDPYNCRACLVDIDQVDGQTVRHLNEASIAVLIGTDEDREIILSYSLHDGYRKFDSLAQLGATLPDHLDVTRRHKAIQWRLFEPQENFFEQQACALIAMQIDVIGAIGDSSSDAGGISTPPHSGKPPEDKGPGLEWYEGMLPDWLSQAGSSDLTLYSRHLKDLAAVHSQNAGKTWQEEILPIRQYTLQALQTAMSADYPEAAQLSLEDFNMRVQSPVVWGSFTVPGKVEIQQFSIVDLALQNLIALATGTKTITSSKGESVPAWLTVDYVETLIRQIDVGRTYLALIKKKLLDVPTEKNRRQALYKEHLQIQLPLLALQSKIRNENGIDDLGYRYVVAAVANDAADQKVEGQTIVIRPLAFLPERRNGEPADIVANMFIIGPTHASSGPCLLYRPMLKPSLIQYPSPANVLYAIQQSSDLRASVLAWLPDAVSSDYERYVFPGTLPSPWTVMEFSVDAHKLWTMSGPMSLDQHGMSGDLFTGLYEANAKALIDLADRESVSNAENRWATLKHTGWLLFNAVLPFLGRTASVAAWIWQVFDDLQTFVQARQANQEQEEWAALTDIFLNLGMAITLHVTSRNPRQRSVETTTGQGVIEPSIEPVPEAPVTVKQLADFNTHELSPQHYSSLRVSGALSPSGAELAKVLASFKISKPQGLSNVPGDPGVRANLYSLEGKWYAEVAQNWFEVSIDANDVVFIIDASRPARVGPTLLNENGKWTIDTRLRLVGSNAKTLEKKAVTLAGEKAKVLRTELSLFETRKKTAQEQLQRNQEDSPGASGSSPDVVRQRYLQDLESQCSDYEEALQKIKTLNALTPMPDYQRRAIGYLKAQLNLAQAAITEVQKTFTPKLKTVLEHVVHPTDSARTAQIEDARQMNTMASDMITRLEYVQTRLRELGALGRDAMDLIRSTRGQLPAYTVPQLRALQVTIARNLCLRAETLTAAPEAWSLLDQIVDRADMAVQCLDDTLYVRSVSRLDERIDTLSSLYEQFKVIDEQIGDFATEFATRVIAQPVTELRERIKAYGQQAMIHLTLLLDERSVLRHRPVPSPTPSRRKIEIIRTRYDGVLAGVRRLTEQGLDTDLVDITSPLTNQIIATFHEKKTGEWLRYVEAPPAQTSAPDLSMSTVAGQALLDQMPAFNARIILQERQPGRTPSGIEQQLHQQALTLKNAGLAIERALTDANLTEGETASATVVKKQLETTAESLYTQARASMLKMTLEQPPTPFAVEWLHLNKEITLKKTVNRRKGTGTVTDYLDEYSITARSSGKILWYAHFHYSDTWIRPDRFLSARLKTVQEHRLGAAADSIIGLNEEQLIHYYRSEISLEQAQRLFFGR